MILNDKWVESSSWGFYSLTGKILSRYFRVGNSGNYNKKVNKFSPPQSGQRTFFFYFRKNRYGMELCQKSLLRDWTHVLEEFFS